MLHNTHLLITHGSQNARVQASASALAERISLTLNSTCALQDCLPHTSGQPCHQVFHAVLEGGTAPLEQQIVEFAQQARRQGLDRLQLLPLFLIPGVHVMEDLPQAVARAQQQLAIEDPSFNLSTLPYLGHLLQQHPNTLQDWGVAHQTTRVFLSHGSRRSDSREVCEAFAQKMGAVPAYWSIEPSLTQTIEQLFTAGHSEIQVLLYFLFSGGITDAIAASLRELEATYPSLKLTCKPTLDQLSDFPSFIAAVLQNSAVSSQSYATATR